MKLNDHITRQLCTLKPSDAIRIPSAREVGVWCGLNLHGHTGWKGLASGWGINHKHQVVEPYVFKFNPIEIDDLEEYHTPPHALVEHSSSSTTNTTGQTMCGCTIRAPKRCVL